jgi:hypothetical protein
MSMSGRCRFCAGSLEDGCGCEYYLEDMAARHAFLALFPDLEGLADIEGRLLREKAARLLAEFSEREGRLSHE